MGKNQRTAYTSDDETAIEDHNESSAVGYNAMRGDDGWNYAKMATEHTSRQRVHTNAKVI